MKKTSYDAKQVKNGVHVAVLSAKFVKEYTDRVGDSAGKHINGAGFAEYS